MKFTPERRKIIVDAIRAGNTKQVAAALAGIGRATLYEWIEKGKEQEPPDGLDKMTLRDLKARAKQNEVKGYTRMKKPQLVKAIIEAETSYRSFLYDLERAEAEGIAEHVKNISAAGLEDWRASAWFLERRDRENFGRKESVQVENNHTGTIQTDHAETYRIELVQKLEQDSHLRDLYRQIWEREQYAKRGD